MPRFHRFLGGALLIIAIPFAIVSISIFDELEDIWIYSASLTLGIAVLWLWVIVTLIASVRLIIRARPVPGWSTAALITYIAMLLLASGPILPFPPDPAVATAAAIVVLGPILIPVIDLVLYVRSFRRRQLPA